LKSKENNYKKKLGCKLFYNYICAIIKLNKMRNLFTRECLTINVVRRQENKIALTISSDFSGSSRKSQLYVNEERLATELEFFWKGIKTKKLLLANVSFSEIDWYDDMCDVYDTPSITIKRGLKKAKVSHQEHGSIPKDWSVDLFCVFADTTTNTPILEVIKSALGGFFDADLEKKFIKELKPLLQKKSNSANISLEYAD
jgi:hypothetical protein